MSAIRVLIVDDHRAVRESLRVMLEQQTDIEVIGEGGTGREAVEYAQTLRPDVLVMDMAMPEDSGLTAARQLRELCSTVRIVVLTRYADDAYLQEFLRAGVAGYVLKRSPSTELLQAVRAVAGGKEYVDSSLMARVTRRFRTPREVNAQSITDREREVLRLIAVGHSNKEVAAVLDLSVKTVEVHKANAMKKLGLRSRTELVEFAVMQGWLQQSYPRRACLRHR